MFFRVPTRASSSARETALLFFIFLFSIDAFAQGTAFTYQGRLNDGANPAGGIYDLRFSIYDALNTGTPQGNPLTNATTAVSNGLFTVTLDFGNQFPGADRWLEIAVRASGGGAFTTLAPRQSISRTPYAMTAGSLVSGGLTPGTYGGAFTFNNPSNHLAGGFTGNGSGLTNIQASSWAKILSLTPPANGDTNWFGPWTPGTLTAGIQEAINALPRAATKDRPGGGTLHFMPGRFDTTTTIYTPVNSNPFTLYLLGSGMSACGITYVGGSAQTVMTVGGPHSGTTTIFGMENMWLASAFNAPTNILHLNGANAYNTGGHGVGGIARASIENCWFGYWNSMTNNPCLGFTPSSCADSGTPHDLIGINVDCNFNDVIAIEKCSFNYCLGISFAADHGVIRDNMFEHCGITAQTGTNSWPATSVYSAGAAITFTEAQQPAGPFWNGNKGWTIQGNHFVNCRLVYFCFDESGYHHLSYDDTFEACPTLIGSTRSRWTFINPFSTDNPNISGYGKYFATNTASFSTWKNNVAPTNMISIWDARKGTYDASFTSTFLGNGSGLTNLNATKLTGTLPTANLPGITTNVSASGLTFYITNGLIMRVSTP